MFNFVVAARETRDIFFFFFRMGDLICETCACKNGSKMNNKDSNNNNNKATTVKPTEELDSRDRFLLRVLFFCPTCCQGLASPRTNLPKIHCYKMGASGTRYLFVIMFRVKAIANPCHSSRIPMGSKCRKQPCAIIGLGVR